MIVMYVHERFYMCIEYVRKCMYLSCIKLTYLVIVVREPGGSGGFGAQHVTRLKRNALLSLLHGKGAHI